MNMPYRSLEYVNDDIEDMIEGLLGQIEQYEPLARAYVVHTLMQRLDAQRERYAELAGK